MVRVLFVCLGNICRSPTADAIFRKKVADAGLENKISVDSAGTGSWHIGKCPDSRAMAAAAARGYDLSPLRARQVSVADFSRFDHILAMDESNLADLEALCPPQQRNKLKLFLAVAPALGMTEVPDPYYGGDQGFEDVLDMVEAAADELLHIIRQSA